MKRMFIGLVVLGVAGVASAQLGSYGSSPACCQLTTSLVQDVVYGKDVPSDERLLINEGPPPNVHFLIDTSSSMRELPQVRNSSHSEFFSITNGCSNPRLDAFQVSRGWDPNLVYPVPDPGTGLGSDMGFPNLFQDDKYYGYLSWGDLSNPSPSFYTKETACQQVPNWNTTNAAEYSQCLSCLSTKGYYKVSNALADPANPVSLKFIFWGRFLNFNPPKYVSLRVALKQTLKDMRRVRAGYSYFSNTAPNTVMGRTQNPSCSQILNDANAFDSNRATYINGMNSLTFTTSTPLARSLLNVGYHFTSADDVYRDQFGFGSGYTYPSAFRNYSLISQGRSVCWGCQPSSIIIISDSEPNPDSLSTQVVSRLRALNGGPTYCPDSLPCNPGTSPSTRDKGLNPDPAATSDDNANYMLDDVAKLLFTQDLQRNTPPVVGDFNTAGKQNLRIHTVGFGINSNLLANTAAVGGGQYYTAEDASQLRAALQELLTIAATQVVSTPLAPVAVDSQPGRGGSYALVPRLKHPGKAATPWQGFLYRFQQVTERHLGCDPLNPYAGYDLNSDGDCDDTHLLDADGDAISETPEGGFVKLASPQSPARPYWEAGQVLKPNALPSTRWQTRRIFTIVDSNADGKIDGKDWPVEFHEANAAMLREYLGISQNPTACSDLALRLGVGSLSPDECARLIIRWYRGADALNPDPSLRGYDRRFLLHDIFHSTPVSVDAPRSKATCKDSPQCLSALFSGRTQLQGGYYVPGMYGSVDAYDKYAYEAGGRDRIALVGSNGGMLHAFHNGKRTGIAPYTGEAYYDAGTGQELWAFIPPDLLPRLRAGLDKHRYFVDGTPMVREVWLDGVGGGTADGVKQWQEFRTVAVVGTGRGGVHRFALDLTRLLAADLVSNPRYPDQPGSFLWMWPQPCDLLALKVGESFSNFAPQPPPVGPVALTPMADDSLRAIAGQGPGGPAPWVIDGVSARERWVVALNGGYDPYNTRGRGMAMVDLMSGHTVWSFFHQDGRSRSEHLRYSITAGLALADVGYGGGDADHLFDTATVGDYGGQLWTVRFWRPGEWNPSTGQVDNWLAARSFRVANLSGRSSSSEALRGPFSTIATNVVQPDTGVLRTLVGTGDSENLADMGTSCRLGNPRACAEQGCAISNQLEVQRGGFLASTSRTSYLGYALDQAMSMEGSAGPACASANVRLSWSSSAGGSCMNSHSGSIDYVCDGSSSTWSCRTVNDTWAVLNYSQYPAPYYQRFYGVATYGGPGRTFNTEAEASMFDANLRTDTDLVNVGQFDEYGNVVNPQVEASPLGTGWYLQYASPAERTGVPATVVNGCVLWSSFEPTQSGAVCSMYEGRNISRLYQADFLSGRANCAQGLYTPPSGNWARYHRFNTQVNMSQVSPQRTPFNDEVHVRATVGTPLGTVSSQVGNTGPLFSLPVTEGPP
jgi:type IV pilus assembly protein PilY1